MEQEVWKPIDGFNGNYEISNFGRLRSNGRKYKMKNGVVRGLKTRIRKPAKSKGYNVLRVHNGTAFFQLKFHRLVAIAFIPNPENKPHINHKNGIRDDNYYLNLEWCTHSENMRHAYDTGLIGNKKSAPRVNKVDIILAIEIKQLLANGLTNREIGEKLSVATDTIYNIKMGKSWAHIPEPEQQIDLKLK